MIPQEQQTELSTRSTRIFEVHRIAADSQEVVRKLCETQDERVTQGRPAPDQVWDPDGTGEGAARDKGMRAVHANVVPKFKFEMFETCGPFRVSSSLRYDRTASTHGEALHDAGDISSQYPNSVPREVLLLHIQLVRRARFDEQILYPSTCFCSDLLPLRSRNLNSVSSWE